MKKTSVLVAVAAIAMTGAVALAQTNVYSRNAVGAVRIEVPPAGQFVMAGFSFKPIGADTITLKDLLGTNQLVKGTTLPTFATRVYIWDPSLGGGGGYLAVFQKADGNFYKTAQTSVQTNPVITTGQAFWIQSPNNSATSMPIFIMGEVLSSNDTDRIHTAGFLMIANPFSAPMNLNDTNINWIADGAKGHASLPTLADNVYVWNGVGYDRFWLKPDGKWYSTLPGYPLATNAIIPVGAGAWYSAKQQFTNSLVRPYPWW